MVATSRLRHAKEAATVNRPYAQKVSEVVHAIAKNAGMDFSHPLLEKHEDGRKLVFLITSDKGLAGAYSSNACKAAEALIEKADDTDFVIVGRKGVGHFKTRGHKVIKEFIGISEHPSSEAARDIALELIQLYKTGEYREPKSGALLPFAPLKAEDQDDLNVEYIYEPDAATVLGFMLPQYLFTVVYAALLQSAASELSSRMNAMSNATDNAEDLMDKLNLHYNKVRQAGITREITEIVGGAEALK